MILLNFVAPPIEAPKPQIVDPCLPSPCGPYSECRAINGAPSCSCRSMYIGSPPNCRPECTTDSDCGNSFACIKQKCIDPCPGSCGFGATCRVVNHVPSCTCLDGYIGNPFTECRLKPLQCKKEINEFYLFLTVLLIKNGHLLITLIASSAPEVKDPCLPFPCGPNANCKSGTCECISGYTGNPYVECRPECVVNTECPSNKACIGNKCKDPCPGVCGWNADCSVVRHVPICACRVDFSGDPFVACNPVQSENEHSLKPFILKSRIPLCKIVCFLLFRAGCCSSLRSFSMRSEFSM